MFMQIDYAQAWFARLCRFVVAAFRRPPEDEVEPWIARLGDDARALGPSDAYVIPILPPVVRVIPPPAPIVHVGASEDWSPKEEIGGAELSRELRPEADVMQEFHDTSCQVVTKLMEDIDGLVAAAMTRLDEVIEEAMWNMETVNA